MTSDVRAARAGCDISTAMKAGRGAHTVDQLVYHFVWIPCYRRKVLTGDVGQRLEELIREIRAVRD